MSINSISEFLGTMNYKDEVIINIFKKAIIPTDIYLIGSYDEYIIKEKDRWDLLAYRFYGTTKLWWLLATYNGIVDPFVSLTPGDKIKIIKKELISNILLKMKGYIE